MTITLSTFYSQLNNLIPDIPTSELTAINRKQQIKAAVRQYSKDAPDVVTEDITGDGGQYYPTSGLASWADELSQIKSAQYPAPTVASDETPVYLEPEDWNDSYYDASARYIYFPNHAPAATENVRVEYTAPYLWATGSTTTTVAQTGHGLALNDPCYQNSAGTWVEAESLQLLATHKVTTLTDADNFVATELAANVPEMDFFAVCNLAACLCCRQIAAKYSRTSDSTISSDSVNHPSRAAEFAKRANDFCAMYRNHLGLDGGGADGDGTTNQGYAEYADWDTFPGWPAGRRFIFHGDR